MLIRFTTPAIYKPEGFGCASFGFAGSPDPKKDAAREWKEEIKGKVYSGTLDEVLNEIPAKGTCGSWQAGIVLFGNCGGENEFMHKLFEKTGCAYTGGAAAFDASTGKTGLISGGKQAAVFMIDDPAYDIKIESENIHNNILETHKIGFSNPRVFETIDDEDAVEWFTKKRAEFGFDASDFEHMTFSDMNNVNCHTSMSDGKLVSGRDLCEEMILRYVKKGDVYPKMNAFYNDDRAMIFGCAGLKGILEQDIMSDTMGMFMFGEVATMNGKPEFGNLMLSKIVFSRR